MALIDPSALDELAIFPLPNAVLFPGALLPLHVFEPRYREMTRDVLNGSKLLAIARLRPGYTEREYLGNPAVFGVAGLGAVVASNQLPDGRYHLVLRGLARVRLVEELATTHAYRRVRAQLLGDELPAVTADLHVSHQQLLALCDRLSVVVKSESGDELRKLARSAEGPGACADVVASALVDDPDERQQLLEQRDPLRRLERVSDFVAQLISQLDPDREMLN